MAFGIHALNISRIVALLRLIHGAAGGTSTHQAASHQSAAGSDGGTTPSPDYSSGCRT